MRQPGGWMFPAARRTRKPAGFSFRQRAGCFQPAAGCFTRAAGCFRQLAGKHSERTIRLAPYGSRNGDRGRPAKGWLGIQERAPGVDPGALQPAQVYAADLGKALRLNGSAPLSEALRQRLAPIGAHGPATVTGIGVVARNGRAEIGRESPLDLPQIGRGEGTESFLVQGEPYIQLLLHGISPFRVKNRLFVTPVSGGEPSVGWDTSVRWPLQPKHLPPWRALSIIRKICSGDK
jgi:hypothetical protein